MTSLSRAAQRRSRLWLLGAVLVCNLLATGGTFAQTSKDVVDLGAAPMSQIDQLQPGQRIKFVGFDGKTYEAIFTAERQLGAPGQPDRFGITSVEEVGPSKSSSGSIQLGTASQSRTIDGSSTGKAEAGGGSSGAAAAAGAAAVAIVGYIAIPPSLREELRERAGALQEAIKNRQAAVQLYSTTLSDSVAGAKASIATLAAAARGTQFAFPAVSLGSSAMPDFSGAPPALRQSLEASYISLTTLPVPSQAHAEIKATGIHAVAGAQQSIRSGDIARAEAAANLAAAAASVLRTAGDLLIGLNPLTAMARDATELITGRDLLTGNALSHGELWVRGVSLGVGLVTSGVGSSVGQALSRIAPVVESAAEGRKLLDYTLDIGSHIRARWWRVGKAVGEVSEASDKAIRDLAFEAITKGDAYWDVKERTTAFFIRHEESWLQVALDVKQGKAVTVVNRRINYDFANVIKTDEGLARRFVPLDEVSLPSSTSPTGSIKLYLPGSRGPSGR